MTYEGIPATKGVRGIATPPGAVTGPFWVVDPGKRFACLLLALMIQEGDGVLLEVAYDEADVLEDRLLGNEPVGAPWFPGSPPHGTPENPVQYRARKIAGGTVSVALTTGFYEYAVAPEGTI